MRTVSRRALVLGALAVVACGLGAMSTANASWQNCPDPGTHVAYNPLTGREIRVGYADELLAAPDRPLWAWACVDDGGITGATSAGTATYVYPNGFPGVLQHTLVCPGVTSDCTQTFVGASVYPAQQPGAVGAEPCVSAVVSQNTACASVGVIPGGLPVSVSLANPNPGAGELCGVNVAGTCAVQKVTVQTGGTVATAYVGTTSVPVSVPAVCVGTNRPGTLVTAQLGSGC